MVVENEKYCCPRSPSNNNWRVVYFLETHNSGQDHYLAMTIAPIALEFAGGLAIVDVRL